jgi:hypothetical protein
MKPNFKFLTAFVILILAVGMACSTFSGGEPTPYPTLPPIPTNPPVQQQQQQQEQPQDQNQNQQEQPVSSDLVTFTDENGLAAFELPGNWTYEHSTGDNYYVDTFGSPDETAFIENLVYDDGEPFVKSQNGKFALNLINTFYSNTGQVGDIRISSDQLMPDGSERLEWTSKSGNYSGVSFFETRGSNNTTFLMFTAWWDNASAQENLDAINGAINSYRVP